MGRINRLPGGRVLSAGARACTSASGDLSCCTYNQLKKLAFSPPALPLLFSTHMLTDRGAETPLPQQLALNDISVGETSGTTPASSTSAVVCVERRMKKFAQHSVNRICAVKRETFILLK